MSIKRLFLWASLAGTVPAAYIGNAAYQTYEYDQLWDCYHTEECEAFDHHDVCVAHDTPVGEENVTDEEPY